MRKIFQTATLVVILSCLSACIFAADMIDNPEYISWSKHQPGTSVTSSREMNMGGMNTSRHEVAKLDSVGSDSLIIDITSTMEVAGQKHDTTIKRTIPAKIEAGSANVPPEFKGSGKVVGKETVEIAGKQYECQVVQFEGENKQGKGSGKIWTTSEIPGNMAKMEMNIESPRSMTMKMTVTNIDEK